MSARLRLLLLLPLALLAGKPPGCTAQGDVLPAALVELVRNSPISSVEDLQLLLLSDSVDEDDVASDADGGHRTPRSLDAQPAQQALCKVRTEVVEVTRAMLDRSNANFLLWPPCVEVQRCSGCCNAKSLRCVAVATHTRHLQVMKIEYINKRPTYAKAVVSVVDHVECRCQTAPRPAAPKKKSSRRQHGHRNQTLSQVKGHLKDELHQWDELKQNQQLRLADLLEHHWGPRGDTFTHLGEGLSEGGVSRSREAVLYAPSWSLNATGPPGANEDPDSGVGTAGGRPEENKTVFLEDENQAGGGGVRSLLNNGSKLPGNPSAGSSPTREPAGERERERERGRERERNRGRPTKEPNPDPPGPERRNETPEGGRSLQREEGNLDEEKKELLLLHRRLDQEKEVLRQQQEKREEEARQRGTERESQHRLHQKQQHRQQTTAPTTGTTTSASATPRRPAGRPGRRRTRKNRQRISKAAMRAMLM